MCDIVAPRVMKSSNIRMLSACILSDLNSAASSISRLLSALEYLCNRSCAFFVIELPANPVLATCAQYRVKRHSTPFSDATVSPDDTGCRRSEIVQLRWSEVRDDVLALADSKTGPRNVPLNAGARRILERQRECGSPFVFPSPRDPARPRGLDLSLWYRVRQEAGIEDVRLHDLRHTLASHA